MSPDDIATLLTEYFTEMVEIVFEHSGTLDKFMATRSWRCGAHRSPTPMTPTRDAMRARPARHSREDECEVEGTGPPAGRDRIGINFGEVFAGNIGSDRRLEYTVIGDAGEHRQPLCFVGGRTRS